ncbi:hypothetical protein B484DRAFT_468837 [Ochromonadaceae sp. CCMP2298]|nr:hypothetical protein B484DRAFT_468837 [Ochromonadaceae sp. CCMP2298]
MDTDRKQIDSRHDETVRLLREEITNRKEEEVKEKHLTFGAGSTYVARGAEPVTTEVWEVSTGTIEVDPRDPPVYLHRFYGVAGWPPPLPDQEPIEAPHGEFSMMDSYRTTGGDLREELTDSSHPLHDLRKRFLFYDFPRTMDVGTRILLMQASDMLWEDLSQPPLTLDKISRSCLCSYAVARTTDDPHGFLYLESPIVIQGPADVVWRDTMRIPVPSVFLPYLIVLAPSPSPGAGSRKRVHADSYGDKDSSDRDDGNDRHRDKRDRRDRDGRDHGRYGGHSRDHGDYADLQGERGNPSRRSTHSRSSRPTTERYKRSREDKGEGHHRRHDHSDHDSDSSSSDSADTNPDVRIFTDTAGIEVGHSKSKVTKLLRGSQSYRSFTSHDQREEVLAIPGNELQNYTSENFIKGVANKFDKDQSVVDGGEKDMGNFSRPTYECQYWFSKAKSVPSLILKVAYFELDLSRNWTEASLRLGYFLPLVRAEELMESGESLTRLDWANCFAGAGEVYGPWWGEVYRDAYQQICNMIARGQCGRDYPFHYLEATTNDALYYVYDAARNPGIEVTLPGQTRPCLPADLRPAQWARALVCAFETLVVSYKKLDKFSNYTFYTKHQPRPPATFKRKKPVIKPALTKVKTTLEKPNPNTTPGPGEGKRAKAREKALLQLTNGSPDNRYMAVCANDLFAHYKAPFKEGVDVKKCDSTCKRLHVKDYPPTQQRKHVLNIAEKYCKPQMEEAAFAKLSADIKADKRMK